MRVNIGRYTIRRELGGGGFADVYHAYDAQFDRDVAIKLMRPHPDIEPERLRALFQKEARIIARLEYPAIVPVYDIGEHEGQPYMVMRYMAGGALRDRLTRYSDWDAAVGLLGMLADAVAKAHALGIVHRDLKPDNILFDADGKPFIADFGIAKLIQETNPRPWSTITGTPAYMSPEQARGAVIDGRTDVYALGVILFELLTGVVPAQTDAPLHRLRPDLTPAQQGVVARALARDPGERFATVNAFVAALQAASRATTPYPVPRTQRTWGAQRGLWQRLAVLFGLGGGVVMCAVALSFLGNGFGRATSLGELATRDPQGTPSATLAEGLGLATPQPPTATPPPATATLPPPTATLIPTAIPQPPRPSLPVLSGTPLPLPVALISPQNAAAVGPLARLGNTSYVLSVAFAPDGQTLASGSEDKTIRVWRASDGTLLRTLEGHTASVLSVAFAPDGQTLASGSYDSTIRLWRTSDGALLRTLKGHTDDVWSVAYAPDGQTLASGSDDNAIRVWRTSDGQLLRTLLGHTDRVWSVAYAPDGQTLASGSADQTIRVWRTSDGQLLRTLEGHTSYVLSVVFARDGETLASGSEDQTIRVWRASDGQLLHTLEGHTARVRSMAFAPDGQTLASGSDDGTMRVWGVVGE